MLLCSGKVYYDLLAERESKGANDVPIVRVEVPTPSQNQKLAEVSERTA